MEKQFNSHMGCGAESHRGTKYIHTHTNIQQRCSKYKQNILGLYIHPTVFDTAFQ